MRLFGTSGIRGDAEKLFTNQFSFDIGRAFCHFLNNHQQKGPIAIGMDPRGSSPRILEAVEQALAFEERSILDQGTSPVPAINYVLKISPAIGSIMISGSHVAAELNGIKFFAFKEEILKNHEVEISQLYEQLKGKEKHQKKEIEVAEDNSANQEYEEMLVKLGGRLPDWQVIVDPGNGAQSDLMPRALGRLGLKVTTINDEYQKGFLARDTEKEGVLKELQGKVIQEKAALGIGYDADGDRVVFIDEQGQFIPGDYSCSLIARESPGDKLVTPINTSQVVEHLGKKVIRTKVGSPYVVKAMKDNQVDFGFEGNGGGVSAEIMMSRDGGSTTVKFLKILAESKKPLSELMAELPQFHIFKDKVDCPWKLNPFIFEEVKKKYSGEKIEDLDGLKVWVEENSWLLFRPSSNAPEFRVFAEAKDKSQATKLVEDGLEFVKELIRQKT